MKEVKKKQTQAPVAVSPATPPASSSSIEEKLSHLSLVSEKENSAAESELAMEAREEEKEDEEQESDGSWEEEEEDDEGGVRWQEEEPQTPPAIDDETAFPSLGGSSTVSSTTVASTWGNWSAAASKPPVVRSSADVPVQAPVRLVPSAREEQDESSPVAMHPVPRTESSEESGTRIIAVGGSSGLASVVTAEKAAEEDDGMGWIGPENMASLRANGNITAMSFGTATNKKKKSSRWKKTTPPAAAGCMTADFTMQNVLLKIGLRVVSVANGLTITKVTNFVLRCSACFTIHYDMARLFCSKCGNAMLQRIACSIDQDTGELQLHLKKNYKHNLQGTGNVLIFCGGKC